ncbi:fibrobacter succinogenes major paralogous domain-containing protein [Candidatus Thioglobus sp.]|nr:fibrobacter succinogenes major paralogous domain-containing protein [Candidatus Thioglobus sp.]
MDRASYGKLVIKLPFDNTGKLTNFALDSTPFRADADMDLALLEMVERSNKIRRSGAFTSETISFAGGTYITIQSPDTGRVWLDRNLGATQVATSSTDAASYGDYYQWGRAADGHESGTSTTTAIRATTITPGTNTFITSASDWTTADSTGSSRASAWINAGTNDICPAGFSVPTKAELEADTINATTTNITNSATAFSSFLKIPVAGTRNRMNGALLNDDTTAYLWSRSADGTFGRSLNVSSGTADFYSNFRAFGFSVRCIKSL